MKGKELSVMESAGLPSTLTKLKADAPQGAKFLPTLNYGWAIQLNDHPTLKVNHLFIDNGGDILNVEEPLLVTAIASRNALRVLVEGEGGKKTYTRGYEPYDGGQNLSAGVYQSLLQRLDGGEAVIQKGATVLLIVKGVTSGRITVCVSEMFKTFQSAFHFAFTNGEFEQRKGMKINQTDWRCALKESKEGNHYPVANKVSNYCEPVDLDDDTMMEMLGAVKANQDAIDNWLNR